MARPPLPVLPTTVVPRLPPSYLLFSHRETASPRIRTLLPHFSSSNASSALPKPPRRTRQVEDFSKTPLEKSIDELKRVKTRVRDSFARMNQTHELFEVDIMETSRIVSTLETEQRNLAELYANLLDYSARLIQRCFRGHIGRRLFRQAMVVRAVLRIQREFREFHRRREETRKKSRVVYRKVLRGLKGVQERKGLSHTELLTRVGHNMQVEAQWRKAMGVEDSENDLITALYRKKYVRRKLGAVFRHLYLLHSIAGYWKSLLPEPEPVVFIDSPEELKNAKVGEIVMDPMAFGVDEMNEIGAAGTSSSIEQNVVVVVPRGRKPVGANKRLARGSNRDELLHRQKVTMREIKQKKGDELRKEEETVKRIMQARNKIATDDRSRTRNGGHKISNEK